MKYYKIADLVLETDLPEFAALNKKLDKYRIDFPTNGIDCSIQILYNKKFDVGNVQPFLEKNGRFYFKDGDSCGFYDYVGENNKYYTYMKTDLMRRNIVFYYNDLSDMFGIPSDEGIGNVLGQLFKEVLIHNGGLVIHASTIKYKGEAVTFTAPSGTGKSTHTALWQQYYPETVIINDDAPAIRKKDGKFRAYGTPWSGKTDINENVSAPLKAMVFLERSKDCRIEEISGMAAFLRMIKEIPMYPFKETSDKMMQTINEMFSEVPSYLLKCDISKTAVETVKNKIYI